MDHVTPLPPVEPEGALRSLAGLVVSNARVGIVVTDAATRILAVNRAFSAVTGYGAEEVLSLTPQVLRSGRHPREFYEEMWRSIAESGAWQGEIWNRRKTGEVYPEWMSLVAVRDDAGRVTNYFAIFTDISERKQIEDAMAHRALHDGLTGLPNRALFLEHLRQAITTHRRSRERLAVLFLDLDRFKRINDELGHDAGDAVLQQVAERIRSALRASDVVARHSGDEFTILMQRIGSLRQVHGRVSALQERIARPIRLPGGDRRVAASVGIAMFPDKAQDPSALIHLADQHMYLEKARRISTGPEATPRASRLGA